MFLDIIFIIILVFVIQYYVMSWIVTYSNKNITMSLNKIYLSGITSLMIGFVYVLLIDYKQGFITNGNYYFGLGIGISLLIYLYKNQIGITDYDWTNSMIELQSNGIMLSEKMSKQKPLNSNQTKCIEFSKYIVKTQEEQIDLLRQLASNSNTKSIFN
jgi:hypothetical protein